MSSAARPVARVGDTMQGYCRGPGHVKDRPFTGTWTQGSDTAMADGLPCIRVGDIGVTDCNHQVTATTGSDMSTDTGIQLHRVGDVCHTEGGGVGTTTSGSDTTLSE